MHSNRVKIWTMWFIVSFFYAYQYILRVLPNVALTDIMTRFDIDAALFGQFSGIYYIGYSLLHLPLGLLIDRFGPKKIMPIFILLTIVGTLPLIITDFWVYPMVGRFLVGAGSSSAILGVFKVIRMSFDEKRFAMILSFSVAIGVFGAIYGGAPINMLKTQWGFEWVVWMLSILGLALAIVSYLVLPKHTEEKKEGSVWHDLKIVLQNKRIIALCIFAGLMIGPLEGFADVWGSTFLQTVHGIDKNTAASLPSLIFFGMAVGGPILSFLANKTRSFLLLLLACALLMTVCFTALLIGKFSALTLTALFFFIGILCAYQVLAICEVSTYVSSKSVGLASAVTNMIIMVFGYVFHSGMGSIIDYFSPREGYTPLDSQKAFIYGVGIIPIALLLSSAGIIVMLLIQRSKTFKV